MTITSTSYACVACLFALTAANGEIPITCPNGETHYEVDVNAIAIKYQATSFITTLKAIGNLSGTFKVAPMVLQQAQDATQVWNELLKGLVLGYNRCAVTNQEYAKFFDLYPKLQAAIQALDAARLASSRAPLTKKSIETSAEAYLTAIKTMADMVSTSLVKAATSATSARVEQQQAHDKIFEMLGEINRKIAPSDATTLDRTVTQTQSAIEQIAAKYGITPDDLNTAITVWQPADTYQYAQKAFYLQDYAKAEQLFSQSLSTLEHAIRRLNVQTAKAALYLGHSRMRLGRFGDAAAAYAKAKEYDSSNVDIRTALGMALMLSGDLKSAAREFQSQVVEARTERDGERLIGSLLAQGMSISIKHPSVARQYLEEANALALKAGDTEQLAGTSVGLASIYMFLGDATHASVAVETAINLLEEHHEYDSYELLCGLAYFIRGSISLGKGSLSGTDFDRALGLLDKSDLSEPGLPLQPLIASLGLFLPTWDLNQINIEVLRRLIALQEKLFTSESPILIISLTGLAQRLLDMGKYLEARGLLDRAKHLIPSGEEYGTLSVFVYRTCAALEVKEKQFLRALTEGRLLLAAVERLTGDADEALVQPLVSLAAAYVANGDVSDSVALVQRAVRIKEKANASHAQAVSLVFRDYGRALEGVGRQKEAYDAYSRSLASSKARGDVDATLYLIANLCYAEGRLDKAEEAAKKALRFQTLYAEETWDAHATYLQHAQILYAEGRLSEALLIWDKHSTFLEGIRNEMPNTYASVQRFRAGTQMIYGDFGSANEILTPVLQFEREHPSAFGRWEYPYDLATHAICESKAGRLDTALKAAREALKVIIDDRTEKYENMAYAASAVSEALFLVKDAPGMRQLYTLSEEWPASEATKTNKMYISARFHRLEGEPVKADESYRELLKVLSKESRFVPDHPTIVPLLLERADIVPEEEAAILARCLRIQERSLPKDCASTRDTRRRIIEGVGIGR